MANNFELQGVGDINITLRGQAASNKILTDPSGGPQHNQSRSFYLGHVDENVKWEGNYDKSNDNLLSILTYDSSNWISFTLGSVDETNTGAPILYTVTENDTMSVREIELTLDGISNITFNIKQNPLVKLLYMIKDSTNTYGSWFECIRINKGTVKKDSQQPPLSYTTDISIYNGISGTNYKNITVEIQPYRNTDVSFGFSLDRNLDSLITSNYTMTKVQDSTFFITDSVKYENGYFYFSTENQKAWTKKATNGNLDIGNNGNIPNVSSHFRFNPISGVNLPEINCYISNMLSYRSITSYNVKITCEESEGTGSCFIQKAYIWGHETEAKDWPSKTGDFIILQNYTGDTGIILTYPEPDPAYGGFDVAVGRLLKLKYSVSIEGYTYIDYDGSVKHSRESLPIDISKDSNILSIIKTWNVTGTVESKATIRFISSSSANKQTFVKDEESWAPNIQELNKGWSISVSGSEPQEGINIRLTSNEWRFVKSGFGGGSISQETTISILTA